MTKQSCFRKSKGFLTVQPASWPRLFSYGAGGGGGGGGGGGAAAAAGAAVSSAERGEAAAGRVGEEEYTYTSGIKPAGD